MHGLPNRLVEDGSYPDDGHAVGGGVALALSGQTPVVYVKPAISRLGCESSIYVLRDGMEVRVTGLGRGIREALTKDYLPWRLVIACPFDRTCRLHLALFRDDHHHCQGRS